MKVTIPTTVTTKGYFNLAVKGRDNSDIINKTPDIENVVTYEGAYTLFFENALHSSMNAVVGTGNTELTRSSAGLTTKTNTTSSGVSAPRNGEVDNLDGTSSLVLTREMSFGTGDVVGTISEVGMQTTSGDFIAGQLIKDEFGNPTTFTILSDEQLVVTYTLEITFPNGTLSTAPIIGTGTVTTPSGSSDYTVYGQPLYNDYAVGSSNLSLRTFAYLSNGGTHHVLSSNGTTSRYDVSPYSALFSSLQANGVVNVFSSTTTAAPNDFNSSDIGYFVFATGEKTYQTEKYGVDTSTNYAFSSSANSTPCVIEFNPSLTKTSSESLKFQAKVVYQV